MVPPAVYVPINLLAFGLTIFVPPLLFLVQYRVRWWWLVCGIASWAVGLVTKIHLYPVWPGSAYPQLDAAVAGAISGLSELLPAAIALAVLRRRNPHLVDILAFGAAIGAFEALFVLVTAGSVGAAGQPGGPTTAPTRLLAPIPVGLLIGAFERPATLVLHTAQRLLVSLTVYQRRVVPGLVALAGFILVDGLASYGHTAGWNWKDPHVLVPMELSIVAAAALWAVVAWLLWRKSGGLPTESPAGGAASTGDDRWYLP